MSPLISVVSGRKVEIMRIPKVRCRFMEKVRKIGLVPGSTIDVLCNDGETIDLGIDGSKISIGPALASGIYVRVLKSEDREKPLNYAGIGKRKNQLTFNADHRP